MGRPPVARPTATTHEPVAFDEGEGALEFQIIEGPKAGRRFALDQRVTVIGKSPDADIQIVARGVSRRHAKVIIASDGARNVLNLVDLESTNGTFVNRERVDVSLLREHDRIQLGANVTLTLARASTQAREATTALTPRQLEIARCVAAGARNAEIARSLEITTRTVASHLERIYSALEIGSRTELTRWLLEQGLEHDTPRRT